MGRKTPRAESYLRKGPILELTVLQPPRRLVRCHHFPPRAPIEAAHRALSGSHYRDAEKLLTFVTLFVGSCGA